MPRRSKKTNAADAAPRASVRDRASSFARRHDLHRPHPLRAIAGHGIIVKKVLLVLLVLVCCAVPVPFVNDAIGYLPLITAVLLIIVSYVYLRILVHGFSFSEESLAPSCERDSDIEFVIYFKNATPLVLTRLEATFYISDLFGNIDASIPATMPLMPRENRDFRFEARFEHIGSYSAGVQKIVVSDLLGLFTHTIVNPNRHMVRVLPKIFDVEKVELEKVSVQETRTAAKPIVTDDMDYAGVREYMLGDPLKNIHWNLSARNPHEEYLTRLFETFGNPGVSIILDTCSPQYSREGLMSVFDGVVESALSMNDYARKKGMDTELIYMNKLGEATKAHVVGVQDSDEIIDSIPRIHVDGSYEGTSLLRREGCSIYAQSNIVYCTAHLDENVVTALAEVQNHRRSPMVFVVVPSELEGLQRRDFLAPMRRLDEAQIPAFAISSGSQIGEGAEA